MVLPENGYCDIFHVLSLGTVNLSYYHYIIIIIFFIIANNDDDSSNNGKIMLFINKVSSIINISISTVTVINTVIAICISISTISLWSLLL